jgi:hypothetical protein
MPGVSLIASLIYMGTKILKLKIIVDVICYWDILFLGRGGTTIIMLIFQTLILKLNGGSSI